VTGSRQQPSPGSWATLVALGVLASLGALFLWGELIVARSGGTPFCAASGAEGCAALWDAPFASRIHALTGLPVAGWGLAWGLVALSLPLVALWRAAEGRPLPVLVSATRYVAGAGVGGVLVLAAVSAAERTFCIGCFGFYGLVAGYAGIALFGWTEAGWPEAARGGALALGSLALTFVALLVPGQRTPGNADEAARSALSAAAAHGTGNAGRDQTLEELVRSLDPTLRQTLSDSLGLYRRSGAPPAPPSRYVLGPKDAPVRITEFTDILCTHCAELQKSLEAIAQNVPEGSFSVEPRQFPLDGACNPLVQRTGAPVRCLAAKVRICMEGRPEEPSVTRALFDEQESLTVERIFELAAPYGKRRDLEACVASSETAAKLAEDIRYAGEFDSDGTPIVLVNGRLGTSFGPFLYAMIMTRGEAAHPAFDSLPPANPSAHLH
jgi:protein-disulfide isomerase